jgi:hypothetical protein
MLAVVAYLFGMVLFLSLLREIKPLAIIVERLPFVGLFIPSWSFFAPVPSMLDYHIFYRELSNEGGKGKWIETHTLPDQRPWYAFLWHPEKKFVKAVLDFVPELLRLSNLTQDNKQICVSLPYLHILNYICSLPRSAPTVKIQFMLVGNSRTREPEMLFISEIHNIE